MIAFSWGKQLQFHVWVYGNYNNELTLMGLINLYNWGVQPFKMIRCPLVQGQSMIKGLLPRKDGNDSHKKEFRYIF